MRAVVWFESTASLQLPVAFQNKPHSLWRNPPTVTSTFTSKDKHCVIWLQPILLITLTTLLNTAFDLPNTALLWASTVRFPYILCIAAFFRWVGLTLSLQTEQYLLCPLVEAMTYHQLKNSALAPHKRTGSTVPWQIIDRNLGLTGFWVRCTEGFKKRKDIKETHVKKWPQCVNCICLSSEWSAAGSYPLPSSDGQMGLLWLAFTLPQLIQRVLNKLPESGQQRERGIGGILDLQYYLCMSSMKQSILAKTAPMQIHLDH